MAEKDNGRSSRPQKQRVIPQYYTLPDKFYFVGNDTKRSIVAWKTKTFIPFLFMAASYLGIGIFLYYLEFTLDLMGWIMLSCIFLLPSALLMLYTFSYRSIFCDLRDRSISIRTHVLFIVIRNHTIPAREVQSIRVIGMFQEDGSKESLPSLFLGMIMTLASVFIPITHFFSVGYEIIKPKEKRYRTVSGIEITLKDATEILTHPCNDAGQCLKAVNVIDEMFHGEIPVIYSLEE